jgi:hypothetical protein
MTRISARWQWRVLGIKRHDMFLHCVLEEVKDKLKAWELFMEQDSLIALTFHIDGRLPEQRRERNLDFTDTPRDPILPQSHP